MSENRFEPVERRLWGLPQRELRLVPLGWQHPKSGKGYYIPLMKRNVMDELEEDDEPNGDYALMPDISGLTDEEVGVCMYETVSDGTPGSPVYPNTPEGKLELLRYVSANVDVPGFSDLKASAEAWAGMLFGTVLIGEEGQITSNPR